MIYQVVRIVHCALNKMFSVSDQLCAALRAAAAAVQCVFFVVCTSSSIDWIVLDDLCVPLVLCTVCQVPVPGAATFGRTL